MFKLFNSRNKAELTFCHKAHTTSTQQGKQATITKAMQGTTLGTRLERVLHVRVQVHTRVQLKPKGLEGYNTGVGSDILLAG